MRSLSSQLLASGFSEDDLGKLDGSGYLIDTNMDGQVDLLSIMLLDQGWFDTRPDVIGLIDPPPVTVTQAIIKVKY